MLGEDSQLPVQGSISWDLHSVVYSLAPFTVISCQKPAIHYLACLALRLQKKHFKGQHVSNYNILALSVAFSSKITASV
jgi:hypothetical protein